MQHHNAVTVTKKSNWHRRQTTAKVDKLVLSREFNSSNDLVD